MQSHILSIILFTPLVGALLILFIPKEKKNAIRWIANIFALGGFLISLPLVPMVLGTALQPGFKFIEGTANNWIPSIGAGYNLGIDGISFLLIMLTTLLGWISILSSWTAIENRVKEYYAWFLILQTGMLGVFMALDFFLFFVFWEAMLVPMYLLIGIWGGPRKLYAAIKFFLYTLAGSVLMLLGILFLYFNHHAVTGIYTFSIPALYKTAPHISDSIAHLAVLRAFSSAFAIKVPMFPFHTWLPDAHVEAPTAGSVILAGVLLKMGTYGFIRFTLPFFPEVVMDRRVRGWMIGAVNHRHHLWRAGFADAEGHEEAGGVFVGQPPGILHARNFRAHAAGSQWLSAAADQSRHLDRRAVLDCRHSVRAAAYPRDFRVRRHLQRHAGLRHHRHDHVPVLHGPAAAERLHRRVHHPAGHVHGELAAGRPGRCPAWSWRRLICCGSISGYSSAPVTNPKNEKLHDLTPREVVDLRSAADSGVLDWSLSQAVLRRFWSSR